MSRNVLALDIRHHGVSAVIVKSSLRDNRISAYAYAPLDGKGDASGSLADALDTIAGSLDITGCDCVVSLPADRFSFRSLQIPFRNRKKIQMVLPFELEPSLPFAADQIVLDFDTLRQDAAQESTDILTAVLPRNELEGYLEALSAYDLDPEAITIGGLPLALWHIRQAEVPGDKLILDIDHGTGTLFASVDNQIQWMRSFPLADPATAEGVKRQVKLSLAAFENQYDYDLENSEMVVSGHGLGGALDREAIERALGIATSSSDIAAAQSLTVSAAENSADIPWGASRMDNALALGLAEIGGYQGLNIYKSQFPAKKIWSRYKDKLVKTGWLAAAVLVLMFVGQLIESYTLTQQINRIKSQALSVYKATFPQTSKVQDPFAEMKIKYREAQKAAGLNVSEAEQVRSIDVLNSISRQIPANVAVEIKRLVIASDNVVISGRTGGYDSVNEVKDRLAQISFFKKVTITSSNIDRSGKEVRFQIKADR